MTNVIIALPNEKDAQAFRKILLRAGYSTAGCCGTGSSVLAKADELSSCIVVCSWRLKDMTCLNLREQLDPSFPMLLIASERYAADLPEGIRHIPLPLKVRTFLDALEEAKERLAPPVRSVSGRPVRSADEREQIGRAKEILIKKNGMTEEQAHYYLQKTSMDSGLNLAGTARMILDLYED